MFIKFKNIHLHQNKMNKIWIGKKSYQKKIFMQ